MPSLTYGTITLTSGNYRVLFPVEFGANVKTYTERRSYSGTVGQFNVTEGNLIEVVIPLRVYGSSLHVLETNIIAINTLIDAGNQNLVYNDGSYNFTFSCVQSPQVNPVHNYEFMVLRRACFDLVLLRLPDFTMVAQ